MIARAAALLLATASLWTTGGGCGDNHPALTPAADAGVEGAYLEPAAFPRDGCQPGALAGLDPEGVWVFGSELVPLGAFRVEAAGEDGLRHAVYAGQIDSTDIRITDDDFFLRFQFEVNGRGTQVRGFDACQLAPRGVAGTAAWCSADLGCVTGAYRAGKLERRAGEAEADGLELLGEWSGNPAAPWGEGFSVNVRVVNDVAYLVRFQDGLRIVDVTDAAAMRDLGAFPIQPGQGEIFNDVKIVDGPGAAARYALVASNRRGVLAIDVSDPAKPALRATFPPALEGESGIDVHTLFVETLGETTYAYLANVTTVSLDVYDVSDPAAPVRRGEYRPPGAEMDDSALLHHLYVEEGRAYLSYWGLGLIVVDTQPDPGHIELVGQLDDYPERSNHSSWVTTTSGGRKLSVMGDEGFGAHLRVVNADETSPTFLRVLGVLDPGRPLSVHNIMAFGDTAYVAWYQDGIRLIDLADPSAPTERAYFNTWDPAAPTSGRSFFEGATGIDVDPITGVVYVADGDRGLLVLRETPSP